MRSRGYDWRREHERLWKALVPARGRAATLQGELVRIAGKLTDQAYRNGNVNWDNDHEVMWGFVGRCLNDPATFGDAERDEIRDAIDEIIREHDAPDVSGEGSCYYLVSERVVVWCMAHPDLIPLEAGTQYDR